MTEQTRTTRNFDVERFQLKQLLKTLGSAHGKGTSMITLVIPSDGSISRTLKKLNEEYSTSSNIKSRL
jgi:peptide chain release factor subunit 1